MAKIQRFEDLEVHLMLLTKRVFLQNNLVKRTPEKISISE